MGQDASAQGLPALDLPPLILSVADEGLPEHVAPPELLPPLIGESAVDDAFPAFVDAMMDEVGHGIDAAMADGVLASVGRELQGRGARLALLTHKVRANDADPFRAKAPGALPGDAADMSWNQLTNHSFGSSKLLAVGVTEKFNGFSSVTTDVNLHHATGPLDVQVKVSGYQGLNMAQSMSVTYDSAALLDLNDILKVGMVARGGLGTLGDLSSAHGSQEAGPIARIKLFGTGTSLSAEGGYTFRMRQDNDPSINRFHANLNLNVKL
jgi:hypothetical protein